MKEINFYLIRHGQTEWNVLERMQGSQNSPLTEKGIEGAKITGQYLASMPFICAYSSTQQRAIDTRDYILAEHNPSVPAIPRFEDADFCEMDFGLWEGQPIAELNLQDDFQLYLNSPRVFTAESNQGEHTLAVLARMQQGLEKIIAQYDTGNVLIVSHGTALRILLNAIRGCEWYAYRDETHSPRIANTSVSIVNFKQADHQSVGQFSLQQYNDVNHLG
ncbi:histidine phosphatase family protein [Utexia brackfieldae]|uniref:histidine phosphatase family protein n=1 Tax=Utexia brackfieldae TaxID=3074108 RepID=UPI00370D00F0